MINTQKCEWVVTIAHTSRYVLFLLIGKLVLRIKFQMKFCRVLILLSANLEAERQNFIGSILNVVDVFLPEVTLLLDKRLHHLNTRAILKDQGKLYGFVLLISNCFINSSAITCLTITPSGWSMIKYPDWKCPWPEVGELEPPGRPSHPQQRMRSWRSPQPPLWAWYVSTITSSSEYLLIL